VLAYQGFMAYVSSPTGRLAALREHTAIGRSRLGFEKDVKR